jgi:hypothetical protein
VDTEAGVVVPHRATCDLLRRASAREPVWRDPLAEADWTDTDIERAAQAYERAARAYERRPPPRGRTHWRGPYRDAGAAQRLAEHVGLPVRSCTLCTQ